MIKIQNCKVNLNAFATESIQRMLGYKPEKDPNFIDAQVCYDSDYPDAFILIPLVETCTRVLKGLPAENQTHYSRAINFKTAIKNGDLVVSEFTENENHIFLESTKIFPEQERPSIIELNDNADKFTANELVKYLIKALTALYAAEEKKGVEKKVPAYVNEDTPVDKFADAVTPRPTSLKPGLRKIIKEKLEYTPKEIDFEYPKVASDFMSNDTIINSYKFITPDYDADAFINH